jgi:hypothetical protein
MFTDACAVSITETYANTLVKSHQSFSCAKCFCGKSVALSCEGLVVSRASCDDNKRSQAPVFGADTSKQAKTS